MTVNIVFSEKISTYKAVNWQGFPVFKRYAQLTNYIKSNFGDEYANLFAQPHIQDSALNGFTKAKWSSHIFTADAKPISSFSTEQQKRFLLLFEQKVNQILKFAENLLNSKDSDENNWGELISLAVEVPDFEHVLVENEDILLVAWGFKLKEKASYGYSISEKIRNTNLIKKEPIQSNKIEEKNDKELNENPEINNQQKPTFSEVPQNNENNNKKEEIKNVAVPENNQVNENNNQNINQEEKQGVLTDNEIKEDINNVPPTEDKEIPWWKKYWKWLLFFILLLLFIIICYLICGRNSTHLPDEPGVVPPIDTTKIEKDSAQVREIISDRLNIALKGEKLNVNEFAKQFKKAYPDKEYKIIYYDTLTYRLQIEIPSSERLKVKNELPKKLPQFEMLIWEEALFQKNYKPSDPGFNDVQQFWYHEKVKAFEAWDITKGNNDIIIAIIDDGFDLSHPEFKGKIYKPWNVVEHSANVNTGAKSQHGTHVAGIAIGLADNASGVSGIAPNCKFMPIQVGDFNGNMSTTAVIDGVLYAIHNGASVVNMSLGMAVDPRIAALPQNEQEAYIQYLFKDEEEFWNNLFQIAYEKNVVFVLAAGNQNVMIGLDPMQRSNQTIKVSATNPYDEKADFSNYGSKSTISAPGVHIFSSIPKSKYTYLDGTSMAAPVVTGGIGLIKSANPTLTFDDIVDLIQSTGIPAKFGNEYVGNVLQLDVALTVADRSRRNQPIVDCPDMQSKIDSLLQEIEKIKRQCPDETAGGDTLKIPPKADDYAFAEGRWKSTSYLYNNAGEKITLYFDFYANGKGKITLVEPNNTQCVADLILKLADGKFIIDQSKSSICNPPPSEYSPYLFECTPDKKGYADGLAVNKTNRANNFRFKLIKIK